MISFIKRRWILLSCAVVLLACTMVDIYAASVRSGRVRSYGLADGAFYFERAPLPIKANTAKMVPGLTPHPTVFLFHRCSLRINRLPRMRLSPFTAMLPLWFPLAVILGWLVIRELRWRETACAPALPSDAGGETRRSRGLTGDNRAKAADAGDITAP